MSFENESPSLEEFFGIINDPQRLSALKELEIVYTPAEERFDRITRMACSVFDMPIALISLVIANNMLWYKSKQGTTDSGQPANEMMSMCGRSIMGSGPFVIEDTHLDRVFKNNHLVKQPPYIRFYAGLPLRTDTGMKLGTLCLLDTKPHIFNDKCRDMLCDLGAWAENELKLSTLLDSHRELTSRVDELHRKAMIDPVTQVWNRNGMEEVVKHELSRAVRRKTSVSLMMVDVDQFKKVNDLHGHHAGDVTLQEVAQRIRRSLRPHDILVRYGGDEFLIFLSDCSFQIATEIAERARLCICRNPIEVEGNLIETTLSIGIVCKDRLINGTIDALIHQADAALYQAKLRGRNCFEVYGL